MRLFKLGICLSFLLFICSCASGSKTIRHSKPSYKPSDAKYLFNKQEGNFYFTVLQINDVYEIAPVQGGKYGGMARVETIHQELLKEDTNTFLMLAGDFLNPSLLGTIKVDGERVKGKQMVDVMNAMNFDLVAFGNHEFDISYKHLQSRLNESNFEWISANVLHNQEGKAHYFHKIKDGKKIAVNDSYIQDVYNKDKVIKVGFISTCIPSNPKDYVSYGDIYAEAERSYGEIKDKTDLVLGLTHLSIEQDIELAKKIPALPLIMGGHEHTNNYITIGNVKIAKADANAKSVYIHRIEFNPITKKTRVKSELRMVDDQIPEDDNVKKVVDKWQAILNKKIKNVIANPIEVIYNAKIPLEGRDTPSRSEQTNMGEIITNAMRFAYDNNVDCALLNGGSIRIDDVLSGDINAVDIFRVLPYGGPILKVEMKGSLLNQVLDFGTQASGTGAYLQRNNVTKKGINWFVNKDVINPEKTYVVAISDYLMKGFDIPFLKEETSGVVKVYRPNNNELSFDIRKAIVEYLKK